MENKTVYIETSVVSYLTTRPTVTYWQLPGKRSLLTGWDMQSNRFDLFTSDITIEEAGRGNPEAGALRLRALSGIPTLPTTEAVVGLSKEGRYRPRP